MHDGIEAPLRRVQVSRDLLLAHQGVEPLAVAGQLQDVLVAERAGAVLVARAWIQQLGRGGANVWHDSLFHKGTKTFERHSWIQNLMLHNLSRELTDDLIMA